jgi:predicted helicase
MVKAKIYYRDIGDYLSRDEKLEIIRKLGSVSNPEMNWVELTPNEHNDWINHRNDKFSEFIPLAPEKKFDAQTQSVFTTYSNGMVTSRDAWIYNYSTKKIDNQIFQMIDYYNNLCKNIIPIADDEVQKISWSANLKNDFKKKYSVRIR